MRAQAGRRAGLVRSSDECRAGSGGARGSGGGVERGGAARTNRAHGAAAALLVSSSAQPCSAQPSSLEWLFTSLGRSRSSPTIRRATNRARDVSPLNSACASRSQTSRARLAGHTCSNAGPTSARDAESWCACYGPGALGWSSGVRAGSLVGVTAASLLSGLFARDAQIPEQERPKVAETTRSTLDRELNAFKLSSTAGRAPRKKLPRRRRARLRRVVHLRCARCSVPLEQGD